MPVTVRTMTFLVTGLVAIAACAGQEDGPEPADLPPLQGIETPAFDELDRDADGAVTEAEAEESWLQSGFVHVDTNRDGVVSEREYRRAMRR